VWNPYLYLNYAEKWQNPIRGYGKDNKMILKKISKNYDTMRTFQETVTGGFKLDE